MDLPRGVYVLECDLTALLPLAGDWGQFVSPSRFPPALRDLSLIVANDVSAAQVEAVIRAELGNWLREVRVFDVYRGKPLPEDRTNLGFRLRLGTGERTLTDEEVEARMARVRARLATEVGAEVRAG
jgi:phenylalanyl-tRNA synthetase beta chain